MNSKRMGGILYGVGVGPGDPEMLTWKAFKCIQESDIIIVPSQPKENCHAYRIVEGVFPDIRKKEILALSFPMTKDEIRLEKAREEIYQEIAVILTENKKAVFLTIGDPAIYSTYSYLHRRVTEEGGSAFMINGISSFCAAAAALGISLGDQDEEIHIIPGSYGIEDSLRLKGTKIYMKAGKNLMKLKKALLSETSYHAMEVYAVSNCGMENERVVRGIEALDEGSGYLTIIIVKDKCINRGRK